MRGLTAARLGKGLASLDVVPTAPQVPTRPKVAPATPKPSPTRRQSAGPERDRSNRDGQPPRLYASLGLAVGEAPIGDVWRDTDVAWPQAAQQAFSADEWTDEITGARHDGGLRWPAARLLSQFPVAALHGRIEAAA